MRIPKLSRVALFLGFLMLATVIAPSAFATSITGTLDITGGISLTSTGIDFLPAGGGTGTVLADAFSNTGTFAVLNSGNPTAEQSGTIYDLSYSSTLPTIFLTGFSSAPDVTLDLDSVNPGVFGASACFAAPAAGQICSPPLSPLNFVNVPAGTGLDTLLSISFAGTAVDTSTGDTSPFTGTLSAQFAGSYQTLLADIASSTPVSSSFSATIVVDGSDGGSGGTTLPEPGSAAMLIAGLAGLALLAPFCGLRLRRNDAA